LNDPGIVADQVHCVCALARIARGNIALRGPGQQQRGELNPEKLGSISEPNFDFLQ
jgi:hypothetical protein